TFKPTPTAVAARFTDGDHHKSMTLRYLVRAGATTCGNVCCWQTAPLCGRSPAWSGIEGAADPRRRPIIAQGAWPPHDQASIGGSFSGDRYGKNVLRPKIGQLDAYKGFQPPLYCKRSCISTPTRSRGNVMTMIASEPRRQLDAAVTGIQIGASVVLGFVALIFFTLGDGSRSPDAVTWRAAVTVVIVGCLISGLIHTVQAIGRSRRRNLAHAPELEAECAPNATMASPAL